MNRCDFQPQADHFVCAACGRKSGKKVPAMCRAKPGLGDIVKSALSAAGITEERVSRAIGRPCGCGKRVEALNRLGRKLGIGGKPENSG